jgi:type I restriction enzyme R subunit
MNLNESTIEHHTIALFQELGYAYAFGPDIGPVGESKEREDYGEPLLLGRLRIFIYRLTSGHIHAPETDQLLELTTG